MCRLSHHQLLHKNIRLQVKVLDVVRCEGTEGGYTEGGYKVICVGAGRDVTPYNLATTLIFPPQQGVDAARINIGEELVVRGVVESNLFDVQGPPVAYTCQLRLSLGQVATEATGDKAR